MHEVIMSLSGISQVVMRQLPTLLLLLLCGPFTAEAADESFALARQHFSPLPETLSDADHPLRPALVALGRKLFFDKRLSTDGTVSCETCHLPGLHATDGRSRAIGVENRLNLRNAPTLLNAALQFRAHWDGSRDSVEDQAKQSLIGPTSFGNPDYSSVIAKLKSLGYEKDFQNAFPGAPDPIQPDHWGSAIGAFERTLVSPSPFDAYLKGAMGGLSDSAKKGLHLFMEIGCANCHDGMLLGGMRYAKFGLFGDVPNITGDEGRARVTKSPSDQNVFKVPQLRNVAVTPPYFHDGSVDDLDQAIRVMAKVQLNKELTPAEVGDLRSFLESLTGPVPSHFSAP
jgi:cytochrome c peroxidase